jgi:hypothetical protein
VAELLRSLDASATTSSRRGGAAAGGERALYRIRLRPGGADPLVAHRDEAAVSADDLAGIRRSLERLDRRPSGPWTFATLGAIADRPGVRAADLAEALGRERLAFKTDVRKLKALGLTISLETGYRLSPRGETVFAALCPACDGGGPGPVTGRGAG